MASLKHQLDNAVKTNQEQKMAKRYQMVRFVGTNPPPLTGLSSLERQKATRRLRQAEKLQQENPSAENKETVDKYDLDLYYTTHFPLTEKYIALYPKSEIESDEVLGKRERIRRELREKMVHGKKKISGSNKVELGKRKRTKRDEEEVASGADTAGDSDEDAFLEVRRPKIAK